MTETAKIYRAAIEVFGGDMQVAVAIEEMAELTKELCKAQRKPPRPPMQLMCDACGKTFMRAPSKYKEKYNFCSEACAWAAHGEAVGYV